MTHPLARLLATPQWIPVRLVPLPNGKTDKLPIDYRTGDVTLKGNDGAHDPAIWLAYGAAVAFAQALGPSHTVGFVITAADPFWCVDVDDALAPNGQWPGSVLELCAALPGTAVEVSQSGRGLHLWGQGPVPEHCGGNVPLPPDHPASAALYSQRRFIAIGTNAVGDMGRPCPAIAAVAARYFPPKVKGETPNEGPRADWRGPEDDDELLRRAMLSRSDASVFSNGTKATFADLFHAEESVLSKAYPSDRDIFNRSLADAALAQHLAFWCGADIARIERLMRRSKLVREKWDREDYLVERTITNACRMQREVLQDKPGPESPLGAPPAPPAAVAATMTARESEVFLNPAAQAELFKGCVYVIEQHRVMVTGGRLLKPEQFRAAFGGHTFLMDARNERTTRHAFEAFTESQVLKCPSVDNVFFDPLQPPGAMVESGARRYVNVYVPNSTPRKAGDPGPFLAHLQKLLPSEADRAALLFYIANMVQLKGRKFQFAPLIVGVAGNGKTFISRCVERALGELHCFWPDPSKIGNQFNAWLLNRLAYLVEDAYIKGTNVPLIERLKPMITSDRIEIEGKGIDQVSGKVCGNFIFNSNHRDAIKRTGDDRRYMVLLCAQQSTEDLARDGMGAAYFANLYRWAEEQDGYAIVSEYLHTLAIPPEFGLSWVMGRAPMTTSTKGAIEATRGPVELAVLDAVDEGLPGFRGGWLSSVMLSRLLESRRLTASRTEIPEMLRGLGYSPHPALGERGQVNNPVLPDGAKPRLYVHADAVEVKGLKDAGQTAAAYSRAQASA